MPLAKNETAGLPAGLFPVTALSGSARLRLQRRYKAFARSGIVPRCAYEENRTNLRPGQLGRRRGLKAEKQRGTGRYFLFFVAFLRHQRKCFYQMQNAKIRRCFLRMAGVSRVLPGFTKLEFCFPGARRI